MTRTGTKVAELAELCRRLGATIKIDEIAAAAISEGIYEGELDDARMRTLKALIRRDIKQIKNEAGENEFASIVVEDQETRRLERRYVQLSLAAIDEWLQVIGYHEHMVHYHGRKAADYRRRAVRAGFEIPVTIQMDLNYGEETDED